MNWCVPENISSLNAVAINNGVDPSKIINPADAEKLQNAIDNLNTIGDISEVL